MLALVSVSQVVESKCVQRVEIRQRVGVLSPPQVTFVAAELRRGGTFAPVASGEILRTLAICLESALAAALSAVLLGAQPIFRPLLEAHDIIDLQNVVD